MPKRIPTTLVEAANDVAWYLRNYAPLQRLVGTATWLRIRDVVLLYVAETAPQNSLEAKYIVSPVSQFVAWASLRGIDIDDPTTLFAPNLVDSWLDERRAAGLTVATRSNYRAALRRVADALNGAAGVSEPLPLTRDKAAPPYSAGELAALAAWARWQPAGMRRRNAALLLALGLGAGLLTKDIRHLRGRDVNREGDAVTIEVSGARPRFVPVLRTYAAPIAERAEVAGDGFLFWPEFQTRSRNMLTDFVSNCRPTDAPRVTMRRLRSTWIVWHFDHRTPLQPLLEAAGVADLQAIQRHVRYAAPIDAALAGQFLRGDHA